MTPAQDATALADELAQISGRCSYERDRETIIKAVAALRATSQTPDAVRIASDFWITISPDKEILRANVRAIGQNIADAITNALRPTPSASAGPQAEAVIEALERMAGHDPRDPGLLWDDNRLLIQSAAQAAKDLLAALQQDGPAK